MSKRDDYLAELSPAERREFELKEQLMALQREYQERAAPILKALSDIAMRKRPEPLVMPDGRIVTYIGPWPYDEHGNRL
jgi:hypothetical protein